MLLFIGGILLFILIITLIPRDIFTFIIEEPTSWVSRIRPTIGVFIPNKTIIRNIGGDLGRGSKYEKINNNIIWKTDKYGFRNDSSKVMEYEIVLVGDSFSAGPSNVSQEFILSTQIGNKVKHNVYNYSPMKIDEYFINNLNTMNIKPKLVIYQVVERIIPKIVGCELKSKNNLNVILMDNIKLILGLDFLSYIEIIINNFLMRGPIIYLEDKINSIFCNLRLPVVVGSDNVLFYKGSLEINSMVIDDDDIRNIAIKLKFINDSLKFLGIDFIFLPVPNKESVYYELLPEETKMNFRNRHYLTKLHDELRSLGVRSIDTYSVFRSRFLAGERLYFLDDTHWNKEGIELASELISKEIKHDMGR